MALLIALLLGLGCPLSPCSYLSLSFRKHILQLALQIFLLGLPGAFFSFSFSQRRWYRATSPSSFCRSAAALTPRAKASTIVTSSSVTLKGSEVPEAAKSQDLTKSWTSVNLVAGSALIKFVGSCRALTGVPPVACEVAPHGYQGASKSLGTRGSITSRPALRARGRSGLIVPLFPSIGRGGSHHLILAAFKSLTLTNGNENTLVKHLQRVTMNRGEKGPGIYLLGLLVHKAPSLFFSAALGFGRHLLGGGIPSLEGRQSYSRLPCTKSKIVRSTKAGTSGTLRKNFKNEKAHCAQKEIVFKKLQLREPVQRLLIARLTLLLLRPFHRLYHLHYKLGDRSRLLILLDEVMKVASRFLLFISWCPKGIPN
ncbi:hypothetical protein Cgig2_028576 [Carnegiea gigantea]|uniref:Uncharacterized protein n=1 Tax=Carnegiea gigantea TaxID=171969 RepID=A0A9Q1QB98_9CARY|nr:hypothetical protein Cgig2_028576 [Carnegiea gigantea]